MRRFTVVLSAVGLTVGTSIASPLHAQFQSAWEASAGVSRAAAPRWLDQRALATALRFDRPHTSLEATGTISDTGRSWLGDAALRALAVTPSLANFQLSLGSDVRRAMGAGRVPLAFRATPLGIRDAYTPSTTWNATTSARVSYASHASGAWIGTSAASRTAGDSTPSSARLGLGVWHRLQGTVISLSLGSRAARLGGRASTLRVSPGRQDTVRIGDSVVVLPQQVVPVVTGDSARASSLYRWSELELRVAWSRDRLALDAVVGARPPVGTLAAATWAQGSGSLAIGTRAALVASAGTVPVGVFGVAPRNRFASVGVRLAPPAFRRAALPDGVRASAAAFAVRRTSSDEYVLSVRAPGARVVEMSGDFSGWKPLALREVSVGLWEVAVHMKPGTHRCNVRIDGAQWIAPIGTTAVDDDFNGRVGLIVAPD